jgi:aryl-alcohol dehydrogenase-like predicted oxidoreductase
MEHRRPGKSELSVSAIGIGTWAIGGDLWGKSDDAEAIAAIQKAIDSGLNLIDTAPAYGDGHSERLVARAIKGHRHQVIIATKCGIRPKKGGLINDLRPASIRKELEDSLKRLETDVIDLYQCHWPDPSTPIEETIGEMARMKAEGKIRAIAVSNFDAALTRKAQKVAQIASNQVPYSLLNREIEDELVPFCLEQNIGILAYGPIGGGILSGKYREKPKFGKDDARAFFYNYYEEPQWTKVQALLEELEKIAARHGNPAAQVAINWVRQQPGITSALVGARNPQQAEANAAAGDWQLSAEDLTTINKALGRIFSEKE